VFALLHLEKLLAVEMLKDVELVKVLVRTVKVLVHQHMTVELVRATVKTVKVVVLHHILVEAVTLLVRYHARAVIHRDTSVTRPSNVVCSTLAAQAVILVQVRTAQVIKAKKLIKQRKV
jgi:hypothetical protein